MKRLLLIITGHVHLHSRVAIQAGSLNNPTFTEEQNSKLLINDSRKIHFQRNSCRNRSRILMNRQIPTCKLKRLISISLTGTVNVKEHIAEMELVQPFKKKILGNIIAEIFKRFHITETSRMLDRMKNLGFKYSTRAGITIGISDIVVLTEQR